jgi:hypothetical protein
LNSDQQFQRVMLTEICSMTSARLAYDGIGGLVQLRATSRNIRQNIIFWIG